MDLLFTSSRERVCVCVYKMWVRAGSFEAGPFLGRIHAYIVVLLVSLSRQTANSNTTTAVAREA